VSKIQKGKQSYIFTHHDSIDSPYIHIDILARLGEFMGIIAPRMVDRTSKEVRTVGDGKVSLRRVSRYVVKALVTSISLALFLRIFSMLATAVWALYLSLAGRRIAWNFQIWNMNRCKRFSRAVQISWSCYSALLWQYWLSYFLGCRWWENQGGDQPWQRPSDL